jgi:surface protein
MGKIKLYNKELVISGNTDEILFDYDSVISPSFLTTWKTTFNRTIALSLVSDGTYNFVVDWGDGTNDTITTWNQPEVTHIYAILGTYNVGMTGTIKGWKLGNSGENANKLISVDNFGTDLNIDGGNFREGENITHFNTSGWTSSNGDMSNMFDGCEKLTSLDLSNLDTSSSLDFQSVFRSCKLLSSIIGIEDLDVSNSLTFSCMFENAYSLTSLDLSSWLSMNDMSSMFNGAYGLQSLILPDGLFNSFRLTRTFSNINIGPTTYTLDTGSWDVSNVYDMDYMFENNSNMTTLDISNWTLNVPSMIGMLDGCPLDSSSYDAILNKLSDTSNGAKIGFDVVFGASLCKYSPAGLVGRNILENTYNWTITDGGPV